MKINSRFVKWGDNKDSINSRGGKKLEISNFQLAMTKSLEALENQLKWNKENKEEIKSFVWVRKCLKTIRKI